MIIVFGAICVDLLLEVDVEINNIKDPELRALYSHFD